MSKGFSSEKWTHVEGFLVKKRPIWEAHPRIAYITPPENINKLCKFCLMNKLHFIGHCILYDIQYIPFSSLSTQIKVYDLDHFILIDCRIWDWMDKISMNQAEVKLHSMGVFPQKKRFNRFISCCLFTQHLFSALSKGQSALHLKLQLKATHQKIQSMKY